jgi:cytochrome c biogenesis protein CcdA
MLELIGAFIAGVLTTLAPCVLPVLPVIVGGSVTPVDSPAGTGGVAVATRTSQTKRALLITASLGVSIFAFTMLLKASTALIGIPASTWQWISGGLLVVLGVVGVWPHLWERLSFRLGLQSRAAGRLSSANQTEGVAGPILVGAALGPVFTSCSPLYGYVIVTVLPAEPVRGLVLLATYIAGLCATLLLIAIAGQSAVRRLKWAADPNGRLRRGIGVIFIVVGVLVATGLMRDLETWLISNAPIAPWNLVTGV